MLKKTNDQSVYVFPKWVNKLPRVIGLFGLFGIVFIVFVFWYWFSPKHLEVGYEPTQPIPFSHRLHAGQLGMDCRYCHTEVMKQPHATIPSTEVCMNCHGQIKKDSPHITKLRESYADDSPVPWVRVHKLPDYVYFNHSRHVNSGVSCVSCHGRVDQMEVVRQVEPLSMSWCLECHRAPEKDLRPVEYVTQLGWETTKDREELGRRLRELYHVNPRIDCNTCHR